MKWYLTPSEIRGFTTCYIWTLLCTPLSNKFLSFVSLPQSQCVDVGLSLQMSAAVWYLSPPKPIHPAPHSLKARQPLPRSICGASLYSWRPPSKTLSDKNEVWRQSERITLLISLSLFSALTWIYLHRLRHCFYFTTLQCSTGACLCSPG